jgi:hypothetical protein
VPTSAPEQFAAQPMLLDASRALGGDPQVFTATQQAAGPKSTFFASVWLLRCLSNRGYRAWHACVRAGPFKLNLPLLPVLESHLRKVRITLTFTPAAQEGSSVCVTAARSVVNTRGLLATWCSAHGAH